MLDDTDLDIPEDSPEPQRSGSRSFVAIAGVLGTLLVLALIAMAVYTLVYLPRQAAEPEEAAQVTNTATASFTPSDTPTVTLTRTPTDTDEPDTETPTSTPVTPIFSLTPDPATATVNALLTAAAAAQTNAASTILTFTPTATSSTSSLPDAGFGDDFGAPGLLMAAGVLMIVIVAARRLRANHN
jgi:hypothetical protein